jgi:Uma2 family endonuclease
MQSPKLDSFVSLEEYLAFEEISEVKHEYWNGRVFECSGGTPRHADLIFNVAAAFAPRLRGHRCRGSSSEQRIRIEASNVSFYPDFVVKCPPEKYSPLDANALTNPALAVEVLSAGSEKRDRGAKFEQYALIPELRDYLLVSQERILVEHFARAENEAWILRRYNEREDVIAFPHLEIEVPLDEIYNAMDLPSGLIALQREIETELS